MQWYTQWYVSSDINAIAMRVQWYNNDGERRQQWYNNDYEWYQIDYIAMIYQWYQLA